MRGILNKPFLICDSVLDIKKLKSLEEEICIGLAKSNWISSTSGSGILKLDSKNSINSYEKKYLNTKLRKNLPTNDNMRRFLKLRYGMQNSCYSVYLRQPTQGKLQHKKGVASGCINVGNNINNFPGLMSFVSKLPFKEIGRIIIFILDHHGEMPIHTDLESQENHTAEFLWFRTNLKKRFFIYNKSENKKYFPKGYSLFFNEADYHGVESSSEMTFSIRVDGKFTNYFKNKIGIDKIKFY